MTKKLRLDLEHLNVESFPTESGGSRRAGTVRGHHHEMWELEQQMKLASIAASGCTDGGPVTSEVYTPVGCTDTTTSQVYTPVGCTEYTQCQVSCGGTCNSCVDTNCCV